MNGYSLIWYLAIIVLVPTCVPAMEKEQSVLGKRAAIELYSGSQETDLLDLDEQRMAKTPRLEAEKELLTLQLISIPTLLITEFDQITPVSTPALRNSEGLFPLPTDGRYKCDYEGCTYAAKQSSTLKAHKLTHTGEKPFKCDYEGCDYAAKQSSTLSGHKLIHTGERRYKCDYPGCTYAAKQSNTLKAHKLIHTGQKPFKCDYEGCNHTTTRMDSLNTHKLIHTDAKPFKCDYEGCNYAARQSGTLAMHKLTHAEASLKFNYCNYCDFATKYRKSLNRHMQTQHPGQDIISIPTPIVAAVKQMT